MPPSARAVASAAAEAVAAPQPPDAPAMAALDIGDDAAEVELSQKFGDDAEEAPVPPSRPPPERPAAAGGAAEEPAPLDAGGAAGAAGFLSTLNSVVRFLRARGTQSPWLDMLLPGFSGGRAAALVARLPSACSLS